MFSPPRTCVVRCRRSTRDSTPGACDWRMVGWSELERVDLFPGPTRGPCGGAPFMSAEGVRVRRRAPRSRGPRGRRSSRRLAPRPDGGTTPRSLIKSWSPSLPAFDFSVPLARRAAESCPSESGPENLPSRRARAPTPPGPLAPGLWTAGSPARRPYKSARRSLRWLRGGRKNATTEPSRPPPVDPRGTDTPDDWVFETMLEGRFLVRLRLKPLPSWHHFSVSDSRPSQSASRSDRRIGESARNT